MLRRCLFSIFKIITSVYSFSNYLLGEENEPLQINFIYTLSLDSVKHKAIVLLSLMLRPLIVFLNNIPDASIQARQRYIAYLLEDILFSKSVFECQLQCMLFLRGG